MTSFSDVYGLREVYPEFREDEYNALKRNARDLVLGSHVTSKEIAERHLFDILNERGLLLRKAHVRDSQLFLELEDLHDKNVETYYICDFDHYYYTSDKSSIKVPYRFSIDFSGNWENLVRVAEKKKKGFFERVLGVFGFRLA